jgi:SAM-dependent methyltransferase
VNFSTKAAEAGSWRTYDPSAPDPGYYEFDSLSARHPDLYHQFAITSTALAERAMTLFDFTGSVVLDVGAGTGRVATAVARHADHVIAVDAYQSVVAFGAASAAGRNISYVQGDGGRLPIADNSVDHIVCGWAVLDRPEAYRVARPGGYVFHMASIPEALCGELTPAVFGADIESWSVAPVLAQPPTDEMVEGVIDEDLRLVAGRLYIHDFPFSADYGSAQDAAAIMGRIVGPAGAEHLLRRAQSTVQWRLRIYYGQVEK